MPSTESILDRQLRRWELERRLARTARDPVETLTPSQPVLTVSRQRGSGGSLMARRLAERFTYTLLHRDLIDRVCAATGYQRRILESLDEHARSELSMWMESMFAGNYVNVSDYVRALVEIVASVARLGGVVVVGRGSNFIVGRERGFHLRVVAPREQRVHDVATREGLSPRLAERAIDASDRERSDFIRKVFGRDIDDPLGYDLVLNRGSFSEAAAVALVAAAAMEKFERLRRAEPAYA